MQMKKHAMTLPRKTPLPSNVTPESFYGFDITDDEVGPGEYRPLAIEIKHLFEGMVTDADEKFEEIFLDRDLDHALRRLMIDPSKAALEHLLEISPTLVGPVKELIELVRMVAPKFPNG